MALVGADLAEAIRIEMGFPNPVSMQLEGWGTGIVTHIQSSAIFNHSLITGTTAAASPLVGGAAANGIITGLSGGALAGLVQPGAGYPSVSSELNIFCTEIANHLLGAMVDFAPGNITGQCTSTPLAPGPLVVGAGTGGTLIGLVGATLADNIHSAIGFPGSTSPELINFCTGIVDYLSAEAEAIYLPGAVVGVCPPGAGPLSAGVGSGGTIL